MSEIEWETPPGSSTDGKRVGQVHEFVKKLKKRPGEWAVYRRDAQNTSGAYTNQARHVGSDWIVRKNPDGETYTYYARWIGDDPS